MVIVGMASNKTRMTDEGLLDIGGGGIKKLKEI